MTSVPSSTATVNSTAVSSTVALACLIEFAHHQHLAVPCALCDEDGRFFDVTSPSSQETDPCPACNGSHLIFPITSPLVSRENIEAARHLLSTLLKEEANKR
jgi:hypothetical protein